MEHVFCKGLRGREIRTIDPVIGLRASSNAVIALYSFTTLTGWNVLSRFTTLQIGDCQHTHKGKAEQKMSR